MIESHQDSKLADSVQLLPSLVTYQGKGTAVEVELCTMSRDTVIIQPHQVIAQLQQVHIEEVPGQCDAKMSEDTFPGQFHLHNTDLTPD